MEQTLLSEYYKIRAIGYGNGRLKKGLSVIHPLEPLLITMSGLRSAILLLVLNHTARNIPTARLQSLQDFFKNMESQLKRSAQRALTPVILIAIAAALLRSVLTRERCSLDL